MTARAGGPLARIGNGVDIAVIGGGIAGATAAAHLAPHASLVLLEQEGELAHHTTSRSAALFFESDDDGIFDQLVPASRSFFDADHPELDAPLLRPLPVLQLGNADQRAEFEATVARARARAPHIEVHVVDGDELRRWCPALTEAAPLGRIETTSAEIDVMALHQLYVRRAVGAGATVARSARVEAIEVGPAGSGRRWRLSTGAGPVEADIVVDAAGAWADGVAAMAGAAPVGLTPMRRTAFTAKVDPALDLSGWPFVYSAIDDLHCYLKPEAGQQLLCSLADESPEGPRDTRPEEIDVALAIDRINRLTTLDLRTVATTWAGQRTFTPDRIPVWGFDDTVEGFFWFAGQGGWGIGTSPAAGQIAKGLIVDGAIPDHVAAFGVGADALSPARFR